MERAVVVTGVSSGIGLATARLLASRGLHVFGSVRRPGDAAPLQAEMGARLTPLHMDVTDGESVRRAATAVAEALGSQRLSGLVNNAGIAVPGPLEFLPAGDLRRQLEVNLVAPLVVTQAFLPLLGASPDRSGAPGRIVMVSSVSGRVAAPFLGPYTASKHGLEGFSDCLRLELLPYGIDVIVIGPGTVATPIWDKAAQVSFEGASGTVYEEPLRRMRSYALAAGRAGWPPERIAEVIHTALTSPRPAARYAPVADRLRTWTLPGLLPRRLLDRIVGRWLGLLPAKRA